eukprot:15365099-Ditylum_brightwellii.AAC.1
MCPKAQKLTFKVLQRNMTSDLGHLKKQRNLRSPKIKVILYILIRAGPELISIVSIIDPYLVDACDLQHAVGYVILDESALLLSKLTVPYAILEEPRQLHLHDVKVYERNLETTLCLMNDLKQDMPNQKRWVLLVFSEEIILSANWSNYKPCYTKKVCPAFCPFDVEAVIGKNNITFLHKYLPLTYKLHVIQAEQKMLELEEEEEEDILSVVLKGLLLSSRVNSNTSRHSIESLGLDSLDKKLHTLENCLHDGIDELDPSRVPISDNDDDDDDGMGGESEHLKRKADPSKTMFPLYVIQCFQT